jgi:hypothetical protein
LTNRTTQNESEQCTANKSLSNGLAEFGVHAFVSESYP